jgi:uncharacterized OsmC-like protein
MPTSTVKYLGQIHTESCHLQSGKVIETDGPTDNHGKGEAFSPTDLAATSLASCMLSIMGIKSIGMGKEIVGASAEVTKIMAADPRRIIEIQIQMTVPDIGYTDKEKEILVNAANTCPVAKSLHTDIYQNVQIEFT